MFLWEKACNMTVYAKNRSPRKVLEYMTPKDEFFGVKPEIGHFYAFLVVQCISMY
jgi:hypothetical protein